MKDHLEKYRGIFPALYACYEPDGSLSPRRIQALTAYLMDAGVPGLYVGGSSGECIYQSVAERKRTLEQVMEVARGRLVVIAHVACNNTADSMDLARHAESLGVDAIAAIPPIYFKLPPHAVAKYWNDISSAAPHTDFILYNIPQLAGTALDSALLKTMLQNQRVIGVKNSSLPAQDIGLWRDAGCIVFNGPDEQLVSGLAAGAVGGIGGTYGAMPALYLKIFRLMEENRVAEARQVQDACRRIICALSACRGNLYAALKAVVAKLGGPDCGGVRAPLPGLAPEDGPQIEKCAAMIREACQKFLGSSD